MIEKSVTFDLNALQALALQQASALPLFENHALQTEISEDMNGDIIGVTVIGVPKEEQPA